MTENKIVQFETIPQLKLGFSAISLGEVDIINKYIDDNTDILPDLSSQLVGQIKQNERSAQPEFILTDEVPQQLGKFFIECAKTYAAEHPFEGHNNITYESYNPMWIYYKLQEYDHKKIEIVERYLEDNTEFTVYFYKENK